MVFTGREAPDGEIAIVVRLGPGLFTVSAEEPERFPECAVMVADPWATPVMTPDVFTVATVVSLELQVTDDVRSFVELSEYVPVALKDNVPVVAIVADGGVTVSPVNETFPVPPPLCWPLPPFPLLPPEGAFFTLPHAASSRPSERMQILLRTFFSSAR